MNSVVLYFMGMSGQWFTWFVNEHDEHFPSTKRTIDQGEYKEYGIEPRLYLNNNEESRVVLKDPYLTTDAPFCCTIYGPHTMDPSTVVMLPDVLTAFKINKVISLRAKKHKHIVKLMATRLVTIKSNWGASCSEFINKFTEHNYDITRSTRILQDNNINVLDYDITSFLNKDEDAYAELCVFLNVTPMHNWKTLVDNMLRDAYNYETQQ